MKFKHYLDRVEDSKEFRKFKKENPKAYLCAGFFVLDFETDKNIHQVDYALPDKKIATFLLDDGAKYKISEQALKKKLPEIKEEAETDIDALKGIVEDEMKNRTVTEKIRKMIAILHIVDDKLIWNIQCILDGLVFLSIHVDDSDQSILKFEKHSLLDLIKTPSQVMLAQPKPEAEQAPQEQISEEEQKEREAKIAEIIGQLKEKVEEARKEKEKPEKKSKKRAKKKSKKK